MADWHRTRLLCTEPLEGRWFLSALAPPGALGTGDGDRDDPDDRDAPLATSDLPPAVRSALAARFPDAAWVEAEPTTEDGSPAYEVSAEANRLSFDATLAADGTLLESEYSPLSLPHADDTATPAGTTPAPEFVRAAAPATATGTPAAIEAEVEPAEDDEADGDVDVAPSKLPRAVADAFGSRYPGARVVEAESGVADDDYEGVGGGREFDITARWRGEVIDVTLTPDGEVVEVEQALTADELPEAVRAWLRDHYPGAAVGDASVMLEDGELGYEVLIDPPDGPPVEATLRVPGAEPPAILLADGGAGAGTDAPEEPAAPEHLAGATSARGAVALDRRASRTDAVSGSNGVDAITGPSVDNGAQELAVVADARGGDGAAGRAVSWARAVLSGSEPSTVAEVAEVRGAEAAQVIAWLPELAGVLDDALPLELVAGAERAIDEILGRIEALTAAVLGTNGADGAGATATASRLTTLAALLAAAQLLRSAARRRRGEPGGSVYFDGSPQSWGWVLGSTSVGASREGSSSTTATSATRAATSAAKGKPRRS